MTPQLEFLKNAMATAQSGNKAVITLLRQICVKAVEAAPPHALITVAGCLLHLGQEATRIESGRN